MEEKDQKIMKNNQQDQTDLIIKIDRLPITQNQYQSQLEIQKVKKHDSHEKSNNWEAFLNFMSSMIGTGVLAIPFAMYQSGYVLGTIIIIALGYFSFKQIQCLLEIVDHRIERIRIKSNDNLIQVQKAENINYQELIFDILGQKSMLFGEYCLVLYQVGACISYIIFFSQFLNEAAKYSGFHISQFISVLITLLILIPFQFIDNIHHFSNLGLYCLLSFFFCATLMFYDAFYIFKNPSSTIYYDRWYSFKESGNLIGVATYAFEGVGLVFHIKQSMKKKNDFNKILSFTMLICAITYILFGVVGVLAYGPKLNQIILMNIPYDGWVSLFCKVGYALGKLLCIPLCLFPCYEIILKYFNLCLEKKISFEQLEDLEQQDTALNHQFKEKCSQYLYRIVILIIMTLIALFIPQFSYFLSFIGGISGLAIQFVIPSILYIEYFFKQQNQHENNKSFYTQVYHFLMAIAGTFLFIFVTYSSIVKLL
ncbi:hypothetical protein ABPG72_006148 [Tetrahymena utriculariae]